LMGILGPIVEILRPAMLHRPQHDSMGDLVAAQLVRDDHPRHVGIVNLTEVRCVWAI
jgi:hypothetical protein